MLNREIALPEANSLFAIATHTIGSGRWWLVEIIGGRAIARDRAAEFRARGTFAELEAATHVWIDEAHTILDTLADADLDRPTGGPDFRDEPFPQSLTVGDALHLVEHTGEAPGTPTRHTSVAGGRSADLIEGAADGIPQCDRAASTDESDRGARRLDWLQ